MVVDNGPQLLAELERLVMTVLLSNDDGDEDAVQAEDVNDIRPLYGRSKRRPPKDPALPSPLLALLPPLPLFDECR